MGRWRFPVFRVDRLWWWIAVASLLCIIGQEIAHSSGLGQVSAAELEGFGDEMEEDEDDEAPPIVVPPAVDIRSGFQTDRGPPAGGTRPDEGAEPFDEAPGGRAPKDAASGESAWDDDEFEGVPPEATPPPPKEKQRPPHGPPPKKVKERAAQKSGAAAAGGRRPFTPWDFIPEMLLGAFLVAYAVNYFLGRRENERLALAWQQQFAAPGGVFEKNFSLLGTGDGGGDEDEPLQIKEGQNVFKLYASGRRFCDGVLVTMDLKFRHDLLSVLWYLVVPRQDEITVEVYMSEEAMDPFVLAVTRRRGAKAYLKDNRDLKDLAQVLDFSARRHWPADELAVISDSREAANEILSDAVIEQVFGEKVFQKHTAELFRLLHFTDQNLTGTQKKLLRFKYALPAAERMADLTRLMAVVPYFIDAVGRFKLGAAACAKAEAARTKKAEEDLKEEQTKHQEALQKKREERRKAELQKQKEHMAKLAPEARAKYEEKLRLKGAKKNMPKVRVSKGK